MYYSASFNNEKYKPGFEGYISGTSDSIVLARRNIRTVKNTLGSSFIFNNKAGATLRISHYVSAASNKDYYLLSREGKLELFPGYQNGHSQTFNNYNVYLLNRWVFAPGSEFTFA